MIGCAATKAQADVGGIMARNKLSRKRISRPALLIVAAMIAAGLIVLALSIRSGSPDEASALDSSMLYAFASGSEPASEEGFAEISGAVYAQAMLYGHDWVARVVRDASFPSDAPWRRVVDRIAAPEPVVDEEHPALMSRVGGIAAMVAAACGSYASDFELHLTGGRQISAYSMADGSIYISYMLAASLGDDELAFALAHEIRHLRACHYRVEGGITWQLEEWHSDAFRALAEDGFAFLSEPSQDFFTQEMECDAYAAFIAAFCGFDPEAGSKLIARLPEGDGLLYPKGEDRQKEIMRISSIMRKDGFMKRYLPALHIRSQVETSLAGGTASPQNAVTPDSIAYSVLRDGAALDLLMMQSQEDAVSFNGPSGLLSTTMGVRLEACSRNAVTMDVALMISSGGISGMEPSTIVMRVLMLRKDDGWQMAAAFDSPGRIGYWNAWTRAEDWLPHSRPAEGGEMKSVLDALVAWKASFTIDPQLHAMCYSTGGVEPYFENEAVTGGLLDLIALSALFSSLEEDAEMRVFDLMARRQGRSFVSVSFVYAVFVRDIPVLAGNARLGMVPERGGWAVAGVSLY